MLTRRGIVLTWPTLIVVGIVVGVLAYAVVRAQRQDTLTLTAEDRLEIQQLLHRYMFVLDSCPDHNSGYDYADLYTEDGQFASQDIQFGMTVKGRDALATVAGRTADGGCSPIRRRGPTNQIHLNLAPIIEPAPEGARGISYLLMIDGPAHEIYWNGWYHDVYARTAKGWRFKSRLHVGGGAVGVPADLSAARGLWEREPTPAGSRSLVGASAPKPESLARDPLQWLMNRGPDTAGK
jgi:SnoaL-like domain